MVRETTTLTPHQLNGPVASAVKWAFKRYIVAQRALGDVVAQARAEAHAGTSEMPFASPLVTGESVAHDDMCVRWISTDAIEQRTVEEWGALPDRADGFLWVDLPTVDDAAERVLTDVFRFHPLAVRDCREPGHVPKVHAYADHLFMMLQVPERGPSGQIQHRELNQFIGSRFLVTAHERLGASPLEVEQLETSAVVGRLEAGRVHPRTPPELSYAITTRLSARMEALVSELARSVAALNQSLREGRVRVSETVIDEMFELRDALLAVETIAAQDHAICARMATLTARVAPPGPHPLLNDILDQFERIRDLCRAKRELLQGVLDFTRTRAATNMDRVMSRIALLGAVALPVTVISDLYGMNVLVFQQMQLNVLAMVLGAIVVFTLGMLRLRPA